MNENNIYMSQCRSQDYEKRGGSSLDWPTGGSGIPPGNGSEGGGFPYLNSSFIVKQNRFDWYPCLNYLQVYLSVVSAELSSELFERALAKLDGLGKDEHFVRESVLDLLRSLAVHQPAEKIQELYSRTSARLRETTDHKEQKKYYRSEPWSQIFIYFIFET